MAIRTIYTRGTPGDSAILNSRMFPYGHSVADWATKKVAPVESAAPNTGLFAWSLNDVWGLDWVRFPSDTQPANWSTGIDEWKLPVRENTCFIQDGFDSISDGANITNRVAPVSRCKNPWLYRVGQQTFVGVTFNGEKSVRIPSTDFAASGIGTYYTIDCGAESYMIHVRACAANTFFGRILFRCSKANKGYWLEFTQNGTNSILRISSFDGTVVTTLIENTGSAAPNLTSGAWYDYYVVVSGSRVRAFVGGFPYHDITYEMTDNFFDTHVGIGTRFNSTYYADFEVLPLSPADEAASIRDRITLLEASTDIISASVPAAIAPVETNLTNLVTARTLLANAYATFAQVAALVVGSDWTAHQREWILSRLKLPGGVAPPPPPVDPVIVIPSDDPAQSVGWIICYDQLSELAANVQITVQLVAGPGTAGHSFNTTQVSATTDVEGYVEFRHLLRGARYKAWRGTSSSRRIVDFTVPNAADFAMPELLSHP